MDPMKDRLSVVIVEMDRERGVLIEESLRVAGDFDITVVGETNDLAGKIRDLNPDMVLVDIANPSRDVLEELTIASGPMVRPVAMFVDRSDEALTRAAIEAGEIGPGETDP